MSQKKNTASESELRPLVARPRPLVAKCTSRRICKIPTGLRTLTGNQVGSQTINNHHQQQPPQQQPTQQQPPPQQVRRAPTINNLEESHPRFGPLYPIDQLSVEAIKNRTWGHVMMMTTNKPLPSSLINTEQQQQNQEQKEQQEAKVMEIYSRAISRIEHEAKEAYINEGVSSDRNFRWMMIKDGCFFLQLALLILGCSQQLGYPSNDPIFGNIKHNKKDLKKWIEAMFYVGNQIPLVVLSEFMRQDFFRGVINQRKWDTVPHGLCERVLYEVLVLPMLNKDHPLIHLDILNLNKDPPLIHLDILHALQDLVTGPDFLPCGRISAYDELIDLEEGNEEETGIDEDDDDCDDDDDDDNSGSPSRLRRILNALRFSRAVDDDHKRVFRSATELERAGIRVTRLESSSGGARSISFQSYYFWAYLYLPVLTVDDNTETVIRSLKTYEACHQQSGRHSREVSSYVRLMSDIVQTRRDAILMKKRGIVQGNPDANDNMVEKLPSTLRRLSSEDVRLTPEFRALKRRVRDYSSPLIHYKGVVNLVAFLTLLQTFFALLAYFKPPTTGK